MDQTTQERLTTLAETYRQKKFRLPKPEVEEAAALLVRTLNEGADGTQAGIKFFRSLPPDATAKAIHDAWATLSDEAKAQLQKGILDLPRGDRFDRLKLVVAAEVTDLDPISGAAFLCRACATLDSKSGGRTSTEIFQWFRKAFLDEVDCRLEKLDISAHPSVVTAPLLGFALQSLYLAAAGSSDIPPALQLKVAKWVFRNQAYPRLKAAQQTQLSEAIKRWPTTVQVELRASLDPLPAGFEFLLSPSQKTDSAPQPQSALTTSSPSPTSATEPAPAKRHWKEIFGELQKQIAELDESNTTTKDQLAVCQETIAKLQQAAKLAETHIQNLTKELGDKSFELEQTVAALSAARTASAEAGCRIDVLESQIAELKQKHQEQVDLLNSRIETEAAHRVESFKHTLARVLRVDYADFKINEAKPMTVELGQGLHHLLTSIFDHLHRNGINAKD